MVTLSLKSLQQLLIASSNVLTTLIAIEFSHSRFRLRIVSVLSSAGGPEAICFIPMDYCSRKRPACRGIFALSFVTGSCLVHIVVVMFVIAFASVLGPLPLLYAFNFFQTGQ